jgi:hypothetical protein
MLVEKGLSRAAFEVFLEVPGGLFIGKPEICNEAPRPEFAGVGRFAVIMVGQPLLQILRKADIVLLPLVDAFDEVNVDHGVNLHEKPSFAKATDGSLRRCAALV